MNCVMRSCRELTLLGLLSDGLLSISSIEIKLSGVFGFRSDSVRISDYTDKLPIMLIMRIMRIMQIVRIVRLVRMMLSMAIVLLVRDEH